MRELKLTPKAVSVLPAVLASSVAPEDLARVQASTLAGHSLKQHDPKLKAKKGPLPDSLEITEGGAQSSLMLEPLAWGDFDGDGLDGMLISVSNGTTEGSLLSARVMVLSRDSETAVLRAVETQ